MRNLRKLFATSDYFCFAIIIPNLELVSENTFNSYRNKKFEITTFQWHLTKKKEKEKKNELCTTALRKFRKISNLASRNFQSVEVIV